MKVTRLFSLLPFAALLCLGRPAHAQRWYTQVTVCDPNGIPAGGWGGRGYYDGSMVSGTVGIRPYSWADDDPPQVDSWGGSGLTGINSDSPAYNRYSGQGDADFTLYACYLWQAYWDYEDTNVPPDPTTKPTPPAALHLLLQTQLAADAFASYSPNGSSAVSPSDYTGLSASGTLRDTYGESVTASAPSGPGPLPGGYQKVHQGGGGRHLVAAPMQEFNDGALYTVTLTGHGNAGASDAITCTGLDGADSAGVTLNGYVTQDNRGVTISSSIEPTYHKDAATGQRVQNVPGSDGTMGADSAIHNDATANVYTAHPIGSWAAGSSYHWYSALTSVSADGTFTSPGDPPYDFDVFYGDQETGQQEHVNLHCTDTADGANATANYYVNWHDEFEGWNTPVDFRQYGSVVRVTPIYHPVAEDSKFSFDVENKVTVSVKATGEGSLGSEKVGEKFGAEIGAEYETAVKTTVEYALVVGKANWVERKPFWRHREGTVDYYDTHGYEAPLHWTLDSAYNPGNPLIDYDEYPRAEVNDPAY